MYEFPHEEQILPNRARNSEPAEAVRELTDDLAARAVGRVVVDEVCSTLSAIKAVRPGDEPMPKTVLQALLARDGQSKEEILARLDARNESVAEVLAALVTVGIVSTTDDYGIRRYQLSDR
jgi:hypothetical protein